MDWLEFQSRSSANCKENSIRLTKNGNERKKFKFNHLLVYCSWWHFSHFPRWVRQRNQFRYLGAMLLWRRDDWYRRRCHRMKWCDRQNSTAALKLLLCQDRCRMPNHICRCPMKPSIFQAHHELDFHCDCIRRAVMNRSKKGIVLNMQFIPNFTFFFYFYSFSKEAWDNKFKSKKKVSNWNWLR